MTGAGTGVQTFGAGSPVAGKMKAGAGKARAIRGEGSGERSPAISGIRETPGGRPARDRTTGNTTAKGPGQKTVNASPAPHREDIQGITGLKNAFPKKEEAAASGTKERPEEGARVMKISAREIKHRKGAFLKKEETAASGTKERPEEGAGVMKIIAREIKDRKNAFPKKEEAAVSGTKESPEEGAGVMKIIAREIKDRKNALPKKEEAAVSGTKERPEEGAGVMKISAREIKDRKNAFPKKEEAVSETKEEREEEILKTALQRKEDHVREDLTGKKNGTKDGTFNRVMTAFSVARKKAQKGSQTPQNRVPTTMTVALERKIPEAEIPARTTRFA